MTNGFRLAVTTRSWLRAVLPFVVVVATSNGCHLLFRSPGQEEARMIEKMSWAVQESLKSNGTRAVVMEDVAVADWDQVSFIAPYSSAAQIERRLGFSWNDVKRFSMDLREDVVLVVFTKDKTVVAAFRYPRVQGDMGDLANGTYTRKDAVLSVERRKSGWLKLALVRRS